MLYRMSSHPLVKVHLQENGLHNGVAGTREGRERWGEREWLMYGQCLSTGQWSTPFTGCTWIAPTVTNFS